MARRLAPRILAWTAIAVVGIPVLAALLFLLPPVRGIALREGLRAAGRALPGTLTVADPAWPGPGHLRLRGVLWRDGADTLLSAGLLEVEFSLAALARKDVAVSRLVAEIQAADIPAVAARFASGDFRDSGAGEPADAPPAFPRQGAFPRVPSVRVDEIALRAGMIRVAPGTTVRDLDLGAGVDVSHASPGEVRVTRLAARVPELGAAVDEAAFRLGPGRASGSVSGRYDSLGPVELRFDTPETGVIQVVATQSAAAPPDVPGLLLRIRPRGRGRDTNGASFSGTVTTPSSGEVAAHPAWVDSARYLPPLDRITLDISGDVTLAPWSARLAVDARPGEWLHGLRVRGAYAGGAVVLDTVSVAAPGLRVDAGGTFRPDSLDADAVARVTGTGWLAPFAAPPAAVDSVNLEIRVSAAGAPSRPRMEAVVRGDAAVSGSAFRLGVDAVADLGDTTVVTLLPVQVLAPGTPFASRQGDAGRVLLSRGAVVADDIRVVGGAGLLAVSGSMDTTRSGRVEAEWRWTGVPELLLQRLEPGSAGALRTHWPSGEGRFVKVAAEFRNGGATDADLRAEVSFALPGPEDLAPLLPGGARVQGLGALRGTLRVDVEAPASAAFIDLDLSPTSWLDAGVARGRVSRSGVRCDTLALGLEGFALRAAGSADSLLDLAFDASVTSMEFVNRFLGDGADTLSMALDASGRIGGDRRRPRGTVTVHGSAARGGLEVPVLDAGGTFDGGALDAWLRAPRGARRGEFALDFLEVTYATQPGDSIALFPARIRLDARNEDLSVSQALRLDLGDGITAEVDSLALVVRGDDLRAEQPFRIRRDASGALTVSDLRLGGSLGRVEADVHRDSVVARGDVAVDLVLPPSLPGIEVPPPLWPRRLRVVAHAAPDSGLSAEVEITGLSLRRQAAQDVRGELRAESDRTTVTLRVDENGSECARGDLVLPVVLDPQAGTYRVTGDPVEGRIELVDFPVPVPGAPDQPAPRVNGTATLGGSARYPEASSDLTVTFPGWPVIADHRLRVQGSLGTADGDAAARAELSLEGAGGRLLQGRLDLPLSWNPDSLVARADRGRDLELYLRGDRLDLSLVNPVLPADLSLGGLLDVETRVGGRVGTLTLDGRLQARSLTADLSDGSRVTFDSDLTLAGTSRQPSLRGRIDVASGVIRIPETPKTLHDAEGAVVLWEAGLEPARVEDETARRDTTRAWLDADFQVDVGIPSGLWIRGRQLEVELSGDLSVGQGDQGLPTVTGDLKVRQGSFVFLGRRFEMREGLVTFYGDDELDPTLDIRLFAVIDEVTVEILLTGSSSRPELELRSDDASLSHGDIMTLILFGKRDDPDDAEMELLAKRSQDVLAAYAAAELNDQLAGQFGVDMISIRTGEGERALVIGKYLNTKTLITYEQALDTVGDSFLKLEYLLTRQIRLNYQYGQTQSGLDLNWTRDY